MRAPLEPPRVVPWTVVAGWAVVGVAPTTLTLVRDGRDLQYALVVAALVLGAAVSSALDDPAEVLVASAPTSRARRRAARLAYAVGFLVATAALLAVAVRIDGAATGMRAGDLLATAAAAAAMSLAITNLVASDAGTVPAGAAGSGGALLVVLLITVCSMRFSWAPTPGVASDTAEWWGLAVFGAVAAVPVFWDPATAPLRRRGRPSSR